MKKALTDIDGALAAQRAAEAPPLDGNADVSFGVYKNQYEQLVMGNKVVWDHGKTLTVDGPMV